MRYAFNTGLGVAFLIAFNVVASDKTGNTTPKEASDKMVSSAKATDNTVSFNGLVSISKQGDKITRFNIGNTDDGMKSSFDIVLDAKGKELADSKIKIVHVKGHVLIKDRKKMLAIDEFTKK